MPQKYKGPVFNPTLSMYKRIAVTFLVLTIILLVVIGYFSLTKATVYITPAIEEAKTDFFVKVQAFDAIAEAQNQQVVAGRLVQAVIEESKSFEATGEKQMAGGTVESPVTLINKRNVDQVLIATTRLLTPDGILFHIKDRVLIPANGSVEAEMYLDKDHQLIGVLKPAKMTVPGLSASLQDLVYAETKAEILPPGQKVKAASAEDLQTAQKVLMDDIIKKAEAEFMKTLDEIELKNAEYNEKLAVEILGKELAASESSLKAGEAGESFQLTIKLKVTGLVVDKYSLSEMALAKIKESMSEGKSVQVFERDNLEFVVEAHDLDKQEATLKVAGKASIAINKENSIFDKEKLSKLTKAEAVAYLESSPAIEAAQVVISPFWSNHMPKIKERIEVVINRESIAN